MTDQLTFTSWFSGGGLADIGAKAAGFKLVAANEWDANIAEVYKRNHGDHIRVGDVCDEKPKNYPDTDLFHASPVCTNASIANADGEESPLDIATAKKTAEFIRVKKPKFFTLENVTGYRSFQSFKIIMNTLDDLGYFYDVSNFNAADFGVPQTRRRLIVRAVRGGFVPPLPAPRRWVGWLEAVEDLIDTFPDTRFAPWQLARLPIHTTDSILMAGSGNTNFKDATPGFGVRAAQLPSHVIASDGGGRMPRAFIVGQQKFNDKLQIKHGHQPIDTLTANRNQRYLRAFVVSGIPAERMSKITVKQQQQPIFTVTTTHQRHPARAWLDSGRVVKITPRGLARFQSVPDWYQLPENDTLACKIIGNGLPSLMYEVIARSFVEFYGCPSQ